MKNTITRSLLIGVLSLAGGTASAQGVYDLCAGETTVALPDGTNAPMWGYGQVVGGTCTDISVPGPQLQADANGDLTINLTNNLPEPTSLVIPGQAMPAGGTGPTWDDGTAGPRTNPQQRVRSFGAETAPGGTQSYSWTGLDAGTLMYLSGTHPQKQLYMGLYGSIAGDPGAAHDNELTLFYSEIDIALNESIACLYPDAAGIANGVDCSAVDTYTTSIHYHPSWFLINGAPYVDGIADIAAGAAGPLVAGDSVLLRFVSAAGETHVPVVQGMHMSIVAEDGVLYTYQDGVSGASAAAPREQYSIMMPPLKTKDAIIRPAAGRFAVYDGNGYMTNPSDPTNFAQGDVPGGMLRFLSVGGGTDSDGDGVLDQLDLCPGTAPGAIVDADGCAPYQLDTDADGVTDDLDQCPNTPAGDTVDGNGCSTGQLDDDNDGVANAADLCPATDPGAIVDADGCAANQLDTDADGVTDDLDQCPNTPAGEAVDANGCSTGQLDDDNDGVANAADLCPNTGAGLPVDADGCAANQLDTDADGVTDDLDQCPNTPAGETVDANGCAPSQLDSDGDGVSDALDQCPNTPPGTVVDGTGCQQNVAPVAAADVFYLTNMTSQAFAAPGVLANDSDADGLVAPITAALVANVNRGTLALAADGSFTYTLEPNSVRVGEVATFSYVANDGELDSNPATVSIRQELSIGVATCTLNNAGTACNWLIEGRSTAPRNTDITVSLGGTAIGTVAKKGGPGWTLRVNGSTVLPGAGSTVDAVAVGQGPNAIVTGFPVTAQ